MEVFSDQESIGHPLQVEIDAYKGTILSLFKKNVDKIPHHHAVKMGQDMLTYRELDILSDKIAATLIGQGLRPDIPVGILLPRSLEFIISIFGILKAGGGFVPMSPSDGEDRLIHIIRDCACPFLLTQKQYLKKNIDLFNTEIFEIELNGTGLNNIPDHPFHQKTIDPDNLAYILYTSGTTGLPKGAMIEHKNLFWLISNYVPTLGPGDRTLQSMSTTCDASIVEIFPALSGGATLVLWKDNFPEMFKKEKITHTCLTPSMAELVDPEDCTDLKNLVIGGEKLTEDVVKKFPSSVKIFNGYGPTECTVACSNTPILDPKRIHIGGKLNQAELYVVDPNNLNLCPTDQIGELLIGGKGVGRGYWNNSDLTAKKYIKNPFGDGIVYRTGDLVKWNNLGDLEYIGRADRQVKVRGHRLELDGVEGIINQFPGVTGSYLLVSNQNLMAYITPSSINLEQLNRHLEKNLPKHAMPFKFFFMENFPINAAGKVDVKKLPKFEEYQEVKENLPQNLSDLEMATLWNKILKLDNSIISLNDNFFELGGNSLSAIRLTHAIRKKFLNSTIQLELIYKNPSLKDFIESLDKVCAKNKTKNENTPFPFLDLIKTIPNSLYFVFAWIFPAIAFFLLVFKFPFLIFYYPFELVFFGIFGNKIHPIFQTFLNQINFDRFNFKEIEIVESVPLDNPKGIVLCFHPHGLMDIHAMALERYLFKKKIRFKSTFAEDLFWLPFNRTFLFLLGYVPAKKDIYKNLGLSEKNIFTTPGDVAEFLQFHKSSTIFLSSNKIFFKIALENGLTLLPIYAFDSEKCFTSYPQLHKFRDKLKLGVLPLAIPIFSGRFYLPIPFKTKSKIAIGSPIKIEKKENPNWKDIEECANLYASQLQHLYEKNKTKDAPPLNII
jgi:amino acid adenylation domain-containing protein